MLGLSLASAFLNMYKGNHDCTTWYLPLKMKLPLDASAVQNYFVMFATQMYAAYTCVGTFSAAATYFISCSFYIEACGLHFKHMFDELDRMLKGGVKQTEFGKMKRLLNEVVLFHMKIIE